METKLLNQEKSHIPLAFLLQFKSTFGLTLGGDEITGIGFGAFGFNKITVEKVGDWLIGDQIVMIFYIII